MENNASSHKCKISMANIMELRLELLPQPPYPPDLASTDLFLCSKMKKKLAGQRFESNKDGTKLLSA